MSSARNHAKRSHRSEHIKRASIGASTRKMLIKETQKPKSASLIGRFVNLFRRGENRSN